MRKTSIIIAIQFILIIMFLVYALVQRTQADEARGIAIENEKRAIEAQMIAEQNAQLANQQMMIAQKNAEEAQRIADECRRKN